MGRRVQSMIFQNVTYSRVSPDDDLIERPRQDSNQKGHAHLCRNFQTFLRRLREKSGSHRTAVIRCPN